MEPRTRLGKRKCEEKRVLLQSALKKAKSVIEFSGGGGSDQIIIREENSSPDISESEDESTDIDVTLTETRNTNEMSEIESVRELGRIIAENMSRQFDRERERDAEREADRERERQHEREREQAREEERQLERERERRRDREREEAALEKYKEIIEGQARHHQKDTELLAGEFEKLRLEKEQSRNRLTQKLPTYDGTNLDFDDWEEKVEAVIKCNDWTLSKLLEALPASLTGQSKRSFDMLTEDDKRTKDALFHGLRVRIDPTSEKKNKERFILARKGIGESVITFIDRCRMYIRRSGGDPKEHFAIEMLKTKVLESLSPTDKKILHATMGSNDELDKIIATADAMVGAQVDMIGAVTQPQLVKEATECMKDQSDLGGLNLVGPNRGTTAQNPYGLALCWNCQKPGHFKRDCKEERFNRNQYPQSQYLQNPYLQNHYPQNPQNPQPNIRFDIARPRPHPYRQPLGDVTNQILNNNTPLVPRYPPPPINTTNGAPGPMLQNQAPTPSQASSSNIPQAHLNSRAPL